MIVLNNNNPITSSKEAKFKQDVSSLNYELKVTLSNNYMNQIDYDDESETVAGYDEMKKYIPSITKTYADILQIKNGQLVYIGKDNNENKWILDLNLKPFDIDNLFNIDEFVRLCKEYDKTAELITIDGKNCLKILNSKLLGKDFSSVYNAWKENTQYMWKMNVKPYPKLEVPNSNSIYLCFFDKDSNLLIRKYAVATKDEWQNIKIVNDVNTSVGKMTFTYGANAYYLIDLDSIKLYENILK